MRQQDKDPFYKEKYLCGDMFVLSSLLYWYAETRGYCRKDREVHEKIQEKKLIRGRRSF